MIFYKALRKVLSESSKSLVGEMLLFTAEQAR